MPETTTSPAPPVATAAACANCGAPLVGPYCAQCGQRFAAHLVSVREIFRDTLEDQFSWNTSFPRTVKALLLHPGLLTTEYVSGRIVRYIPPMRLYLAASLLFFLVLSYRTGVLGGQTPIVTVSATATHPTASGGSPAPAKAQAAPAESPATPADSGVHGGISIDTTTGPAWLRERLAAQQRRLAGMPPAQVSRMLFTGFMDAAPKVVFLLVPVFALLLKGLYIRRRRLYVEHFVFALHLHAVAFLVFTVFALLRSSWLNLALAAWMAVYGFLAMRRVYGQGWLRTFVKYIAVSFGYFIVVMAGVVAGALFVVLNA